MNKQPEERTLVHDFFVSYNKADKDWAAWIAWQLEAAGRIVFIQAWDFRPGENFVLEMQEALASSKQTIMVLSEDYLNSSFTAPEWAAVFAADPTAKDQKLVPVRVRKCKPQGLLATLIYVDLVGLSQDAATAALLGAFSRRAKPSAIPAFPSDRTQDTVLPISFPGASDHDVHASPPPAFDFEATAASALLSARERLQVIAKLNAIVPAQFNILVFSLKPPDGLVPPMPAPQADRSTALLTWAESPSGSGLQVVKEVLDYVCKPQLFSPHPEGEGDVEKSILRDEVLPGAKSNRQSTSSFWTSMPGFLTGIAAIMTAIIALYGAIHHSVPTAILFVNPNTIQKGQSSTLTWQTTDANVVSIEEIGAITPNGSRQVTPDSSITYHLTATGAGGTQKAAAQISVTSARPQITIDGPTTLEPGQTRNIPLSLTRGGQVEVVIQSLIQDWSGFSGEKGLLGQDGLYVSICSAKSSGACAHQQMKASQAFVQDLPPGSGTLSVFNFTTSPRMSVTLRIKQSDDVDQ
jgi:hypothetical protein